MVRSLALAGAITALVSSPLFASTISGNVTAKIAAPAGCASTGDFVCGGGGSNSLQWGSGDWENQSVDGTNPSVLTVSEDAFSISAPGQVSLGTITWVNMASWYTGGVWDSAIILELGDPSKSVSLGFSVDNTGDPTNNASVNNTTGHNPDILTLMSGPLGTPLELGHGLRLTELTFSLEDAGTPGEDTSEWFWNYDEGKYEWLTFEGLDWGSKFDPATGIWENREGGTSVMRVYGTVSAVPLPAGIWLLISGLGGAFVFGRRRQSA